MAQWSGFPCLFCTTTFQVHFPFLRHTHTRHVFDVKMHQHFGTAQHSYAVKCILNSIEMHVALGAVHFRCFISQVYVFDFFFLFYYCCCCYFTVMFFLVVFCLFCIWFGSFFYAVVWVAVCVCVCVFATFSRVISSIRQHCRFVRALRLFRRIITHRNILFILP